VNDSCFIGNIYGAEISKNAAFVLIDADGKVGMGAVDANRNKVVLPGPQTMLDELHKQQKRITELEADAARQRKQIETLTASLQKVSAQLDASKATRQVVLSDR
jgi:multidrug resistance efflux pump